ncbi:MAG: DUF177 domain-containing protein [Burkholderiaceae bacterium]|nr:DUF177 domain-containing protein [Burkholderiaceae bacterium]
MSIHPIDPRSVDVAAFAKQGGDESGSCALVLLDRLCDEAHADAKPTAAEQMQWRATGESRPKRGAEAEVWLHLEGQARLALVCQRCLQPVEAALQARRSFQFVAGEEQAAAIDADSEDDVLALSRTLDLIGLVEDELLLALPLVPRHEACPQPLKVRDDGDLFEERVHPFAALGDLKRKLPSS